MQARATEPGVTARCVVWRDSAAISSELAAALARPDFSVVQTTNEFEAIAQLCRPTTGPHRVLLIVEPSRLRSLPEFLSLLERYAPGAVLWAYESAAPSRLRAASQEDKARWSTPVEPPRRSPAPVIRPATKRIADEAVSTTRIKIAQPQLRLTGDGPHEEIPPKLPTTYPQAELKVAPASNNTPDQAEITPPAPPVRTTHLLTDDELAMLLATEPGTGHN